MRAALSAFVLFAACNAVAPPPEAMPGCNPLVGDDCLTPFPSSFHEAIDTTTATGVRVQIGAGALPVQANGVAIKPDRLNQKDGFSPSTPFLVYFKAGVDATDLPTADTLDQTLQAGSPVQVIDFQTGERVPVMAELDANVATGDRQALIVRPMKRLRPATRYVVALVGLKDKTGKPLVPAPFRALRDGNPLSKSLTPLKPRYDEIFAALQKAGVARAQLTLAWDVTTASDATATGHLLAMRDEALGMASAKQLGYGITSSTDSPSDPHLFREILATVKVPSYLADDSGKSMLNFGADGKPQMRALVDAPFVIHVPQCAKTATGPLPTVVFGHGLFGNALDTLRNATLEAVADTTCAVFIGTDWIGLSSNDVSNIGNVLASDLNQMYVVTDRLQQAHVNAQVMTRVFLTQIVNDAVMQVNGHAVTDGKEVYYFGVSLGGIQGATFMTLSPDVVRGVLNVPGCDWSLLIFRSTDFNALKPLLDSSLPDPLDQEVAIAATQSEWDYTDPAAYAPHVIADPLPNTPAKRILVQESIGDAQVTNLATRVLVRTMGLSGLDLEQPVMGIDAKPAPLDSAYTQWDSHPTPLPPSTNTSLPADNHAHDAVWAWPLAQQQIRAFLTPTGQVTDVCNGGPCSITK